MGPRVRHRRHDGGSAGGTFVYVFGYQPIAEGVRVFFAY